MNRKTLIKRLLISSVALLGIVLGSSLSTNSVNASSFTQKIAIGKPATEKYQAAEDESGTVGTVPYRIEGGILTLGSGTISEKTALVYPWYGESGITKVEITGPIELKENTPVRMFAYMPNLAEIDGMQNLNTAEATDMSGMFTFDDRLVNLDVSKFDTTNVQDMSSMFYNDMTLTTLDLSNFNTRKVTDMSSMFGSDMSLTHLNISSFNTENVMDMSGMFHKDQQLQVLDLSNFDTRRAVLDGRLTGLLSSMINLRILKLGPNVNFDRDKVSGKPALNSPNGTENWQAVAADKGGTLEEPRGSIYSPNDLVDLYGITNPKHPTKDETWVPETDFVDELDLEVQLTYNMSAGTKFDPSAVFVSLTTGAGQVITNYQNALDAGMTVSGDQFDTTTAGTHTVTFNYFDKEAATQVTVTSSGGGGGGDGGNVTPTPTPTPNPEVASNPAAPAPQPQPTPTEPSTPPAKPTTPNEATKYEAAIYAVKGIYLYQHATFNKSQRIAKYPKQKRIKRPMFIITDYARSNGGALRYKVRDVNAGTKAVGKVGYITANQKYVQSAYYQTMPKNNRIRVISLKGIHAYKNQNLTGRFKTYKKGARLTVKKIVKHNLTTRYQLKNGLYITGNKKLIIHDQY